MENLRELALLLLGWSLGTLSPSIERVILRRRRRKELLAGLAYECNELRLTLANALVTTQASLGMLDQSTIDLVKPILTTYADVLERPSLELLRQLFSKPDEEVIRGLIAAQTSKTDAFGGSYSKRPMPYALPLLASHIGELDLLPVAQQQALLRVDAELRLFNEQVAYVRELHDRSFTLAGDNHALNASNLALAQNTYGTRCERLIKALNLFVAHDGSPLKSG